MPSCHLKWCTFVQVCHTFATHGFPLASPTSSALLDAMKSALNLYRKYSQAGMAKPFFSILGPKPHPAPSCMERQSESSKGFCQILPTPDAWSFDGNAC